MSFFPQNCQNLAGLSQTPLTRSQIERHVRQALADLHDTVALRRNPLRDYVRKAIDELDPGASVDTRAARPYRVLQLRYVEGRTATEAARLLALSTSQYYREHQLALDALTTLVVDQLSVAQPQPHNLPAQITSFVGRDEELRRLSNLVANSRLVTLTGAGGCGKTRLGLEAATRQLDNFPDGVWLVDLTPLADPNRVAQTVAFTLGIRETSADLIVSSIVDGLRSKRVLLLLDNCEHVLEACAQLVNALLRGCPRLTVMLTSRELLGITGETVFQVPPLAFPSQSDPGGGSDILQFPAVKLFVERASAVSPEFRFTGENTPSIVQICTRLDGLPLAIELAAARMNVFSPQQLALRLSDRFRVLTAGSRSAPLHHQTLHALVDWSYELLDSNERRLFAHLAVFAGGWTLQAAETVCSESGLEVADVANLLAGLVERSLVLAERSNDEMRYRMLETLREFASERLDQTPQATTLRRRHSRYYAGLAEQLEAMMYGPQQVAALRQIELEHNNFRAVLANGSNDAESARLSARVAASLGLFWFVGNYFTEARHWFGWILSLSAIDGEPAAVRCLALDGFLAASMGEHLGGLHSCDQAVKQAEQCGDAPTRAFTYYGRCATSFVTGDAIGTERDARVGMQMCAAAGWPWGAALCSAWLGRSLLMQQRAAEAVVSLRQTLEVCRTIGDPLSVALALSFYAAALGAEGDYDTAARSLGEALDLFRPIGCIAQMSRCPG